MRTDPYTHTHTHRAMLLQPPFQDPLLLQDERLSRMRLFSQNLRAPFRRLGSMPVSRAADHSCSCFCFTSAAGKRQKHCTEFHFKLKIRLQDFHIESPHLVRVAARAKLFLHRRVLLLFLLLLLLFSSLLFPISTRSLGLAVLSSIFIPLSPIVRFF